MASAHRRTDLIPRRRSSSPASSSSTSRVPNGPKRSPPRSLRHSSVRGRCGRSLADQPQVVLAGGEGGVEGAEGEPGGTADPVPGGQYVARALVGGHLSERGGA